MLKFNSPGVFSHEQRALGSKVSLSIENVRKHAPEDSKQKLMFMFTIYFLSPYISFTE